MELTKTRLPWVAVALVVLTVVSYWPVVHHGFVTYDDPLYVCDNYQVLGGLSRAGLIWAFTNFDQASNWHPLTWLSHMLDVQLFGVNAPSFHRVNLFFHAANAVLLLLVLRAYTGALWRSALVALLFALHPLHVESVAWIAERKDLLFTFFWFLAMAAYLRYVRKPGMSGYLLLVFLFLLGLLSKPMIVTLPLALLLMDYWPLGRLRRIQGAAGFGVRYKRAVMEKIPLLLLSVISAVVTYHAQESSGAMGNWTTYPLHTRAANALLAVVLYIRDMIWPAGLSVIYPYAVPDGIWWQAGAAGLFLAGATALTLTVARSRPALATGWLWYLGTLIPVLGLVQVGAQSRADRYTYVTLTGLFMMIAWGLGERSHLRLSGRLIAVAVTGFCAVALMAAARHQVTLWRDGITLFRHADRVTSANWVARNHLGKLMAEARQYEEAIRYLDSSLGINPSQPTANNSLGNIYATLGRNDEAIRHFREALRLKPGYPVARYNLGLLFLQQGNQEEAITNFRLALQGRPDFLPARRSLEQCLARRRAGGGI